MEIPTRALILKKGTAEQIKNIVFPLAEIVFDTTNKRLVVGDGETKGGIVFPNMNDLEQLLKAKKGQ